VDATGLADLCVSTGAPSTLRTSAGQAARSTPLCSAIIVEPDRKESPFR
jgi:hypothetical protein